LTISQKQNSVNAFQIFRQDCEKSKVISVIIEGTGEMHMTAAAVVCCFVGGMPHVPHVATQKK